MSKTTRHTHGQTRAQLKGLPPCDHCRNPIGPGEAYDHEEEESGNVKVRHLVPLYFDECALATRELLMKLGFCIVPSLPRGTPDVEWLATAGKNGWSVITQDRMMSRRKDELDTIISNKVKCFFLPTRTKNRWDEVRGFVSRWEKIRIESLREGPFIWQFNDESRLIRCELIYPEALEFKAIDLSNVPVGHLLNMFADIVAQYDQGWFSFEFVEALHDCVRSEIEARISGDRSRATTPAEDGLGELLYSTEIRPGDESREDVLEKPVDLSKFRMIVMCATDQYGLVYPWMVPSSRVSANILSADDDIDPKSPSVVRFSGFPTGFHRSGFGIVERPKGLD